MDFKKKLCKLTWLCRGAFLIVV